MKNYFQRKLKIWLSFIAILIWSNVSSAATCPAEKRVIIHINGILTNYDEAHLNRERLRQSWRRISGATDRQTEFRFIHNPSAKDILYGAGGVADLIESISQALGLTASSIIRGLAGFEILPAGVRDRLIEYSVAAVVGFNPDQATLNKITYVAEDIVSAGGKVIFVPHSQGNLFTNSVARILPASSIGSVGTVGVAVPANSIEPAPYASYVTLSEDLVINGLRLRIPVLPSTTTNGYTIVDTEDFYHVLFHGFRQSYMELARPSEAAIIRLIDDGFFRLASPCFEPPPPIPAPNADNLLGSLGLNLTNQSCGNPSTAGSLSLTTNTFSGLGCFQAIRFAEVEWYLYAQNDFINCGESCTRGLEVSYRNGDLAVDTAGTSVTKVSIFLPLNTGNPPSLNRAWDPLTRPLKITAENRLRYWINAISRVSCQRYSGAAPPVINNATHTIELEGETISLRNASGLIASSPVNRLSGGRLEERFSPTSKSYFSYGAANDVSATLTMNFTAAPAKFDFRADMLDTTGRPTRVNCTNVPF